MSQVMTNGNIDNIVVILLIWFDVVQLKNKLVLLYRKNNLKIMNLKKGVEIDHCNKK